MIRVKEASLNVHRGARSDPMIVSLIACFYFSYFKITAAKVIQAVNLSARKQTAQRVRGITLEADERWNSPQAQCSSTFLDKPKCS